MAWDDDLRPQQREAAGLERGDAVLLAGPGTGKTFVLVRRVQFLVDVHGIRPRHVTALTFTRAAAAEMRDRLVRRLGEDGQAVRVSTLHSYALRELLRQGAAGLPVPVRVVGDWEERWVVVEELARMLGRMVREIRDAILRLADDWDTLAADGEGWDDGFPDPQFLDAWRRHREVYGYTLRPELVYQLLCELRINPNFSPATPCEIALVDEYQDLNLCDLTTIHTLADRAESEVFAAGDDDQSIYSFRHAHPVGIRNFETDYPGANKPVLTECLRCGQGIVDLANWLIAQEPGRIPKNLVSVTQWPGEVHLLRFRDQNVEALDIARVIRAEVDVGTHPEDVLILLRSDPDGRVSRTIVDALAGQRLEAYLPRAVQGDEERIQALLEYLILSQALEEENRIDDLALRSLLQLEPNGIGPSRLWAATTYSLERGIRFAAAIDRFRDNPGEFPAAGVAGLIAAVDAIVERAKQFVQLIDESFEDWLTRIADALGIAGDDLSTVLVIGAEAQAEIERHAAEGLQGMTFAQAMAASMSKVADTLPPAYPGFVTITTMHGAKGLSADIVFVLQAEDEALPGGATGIAYDEARRLLYVSLTRARKKLFIGACERRVGPQRFVGAAELVRRNLTRFLRDYGFVAETADQYLGS